jgi:hypothetical protein
LNKHFLWLQFKLSVKALIMQKVLKAEINNTEL